MAEWLFDYHEVLEDPEGCWWHVVGRWKDVDNEHRKYELADATHTEYKTLHKLDVEGLDSEAPMFEGLGWETNTKPAAENGYRVNGVLCGPSRVVHYRNKECIHSYECPSCGADGKRAIDIIHNIEGGEVRKTTLICRSCNTHWRADDD